MQQSDPEKDGLELTQGSPYLPLTAEQTVAALYELYKQSPPPQLTPEECDKFEQAWKHLFSSSH